MIRLTQALERLVANCGGEAWCRKIHEEKPETVELYRDEKRGFVLLAHTERKGLYRPPHARFSSFRREVAGARLPNYL